MKNKQMLAVFLIVTFVSPTVATVPTGTVTALGLVGAATLVNYGERKLVRDNIKELNKTLDPITSTNIAQAVAVGSGIYLCSKFACKGLRNTLTAENSVILPAGILFGAVIDKALCKLQAVSCPATKANGETEVKVKPNIFRTGLSAVTGIALSGYLYNRFVK